MRAQQRPRLRSSLRLQFFGSYVLALSHSHAGYLYCSQRGQQSSAGYLCYINAYPLVMYSTLSPSLSLSLLLSHSPRRPTPAAANQSKQLNATCKCRLPPGGKGQAEAAEWKGVEREG